MRRSKVANVGVVLVTFAVSMAACAHGKGPDAGAPAAPTSRPPERWLAAVQVAGRADDLDAATERLRDLLGPALVVSPLDCFQGLPDEAGEGYVIGALADTEAAAEQLLSEAGETASFTASVTILCSD